MIRNDLDLGVRINGHNRVKDAAQRGQAYAK